MDTSESIQIEQPTAEQIPKEIPIEKSSKTAEELDAALIMQFKADWDTYTMPDLSQRYNVGNYVLRKWGRKYQCTFPKSKKLKSLCARKVLSSKNIIIDTPMSQINKPDLNKVGIEHNEELKVCNDEFMKVLKDTTMPKREKDALLFSIAEKALGIYIELQPSTNRYMSCMVDFYKLKLYEKKVAISDRESTEIDVQTLKNLKKKFISEAMDDIVSALTDNERMIFESLVNTAANRILEDRKNLIEASQQKIRELNGHSSASDDVVDVEVNL